MNRVMDLLANLMYDLRTWAARKLVDLTTAVHPEPYLNVHVWPFISGAVQAKAYIRACALYDQIWEEESK